MILWNVRTVKAVANTGFSRRNQPLASFCRKPHKIEALSAQAGLVLVWERPYLDLDKERARFVERIYDAGRARLFTVRGCR
jgi:hypothetical protein